MMEPLESLRKPVFVDPQAELRRAYKLAIKADRVERERLAASGIPPWRIGDAMKGNPACMDFGRFHALCCGARNRRGEPCRRRGLFANGRCQNHGGPSTGPRTEAGKARALVNLAQRPRVEPHE